jgi:uncharacterized protein (DUF58 family)
LETKELLKRVRKIEIKSRGLSSQLFSGEYHSAFKGRGMSFSEVREYQPGDDIRTIDWNVTARFNHPYVKVFEEERELTIMLLVDMSGSGSFGTQEQFKLELITELCAVIAFSALQNNDKVGVILFSNGIEKFIPPKKGRKHVLRIIRELIDFEPKQNETDIGEALRFLMNVTKKRSTVFLLSDFIDRGYEDSIRIAAQKHDFVALRISDPREVELPDVGLVKFMDAETGKTMWVDTSDKKVRKAYHIKHKESETYTKQVLRKAGVDFADIHTNKSYVNPLMNLFKRRGK